MRRPAMPKLFRTIGLGILARRAFGELRALRQAVEQQNALLTRLADHFAPLPPTVERREITTDTGVSFLDPLEQALAQDYIARTTIDTGRAPTEDEVLIYLADEKTQALQQRLVARDDEVARMVSDRRARGVGR